MATQVGRTSILSAMSRGPCSYAWSLVVGFVLGSLGFILQELARSGYNASDQLATFTICAGGAMALMLGGAAAINFVIGRRIQQDIALQRQLFSGSELPPPVARPNVPGIMLCAAPAANPSARSSAETEPV